MGKTFSLLALVIVCAIWAWISVRKYAARKRLGEERAAAFMAEAMNAMKKTRSARDKT